MGFLDDILNIGQELGNVKNEVTGAAEEATQGIADTTESVRGVTDELGQQVTDIKDSILGSSAEPSDEK